MPGERKGELSGLLNHQAKIFGDSNIYCFILGGQIVRLPDPLVAGRLSIRDYKRTRL